MSTDSNPADLATRGINITEIENSLWMQGPFFLFKEFECSQVEFPLIDADSDKEVKPLINVNKNQLDHNEKPSIVKRLEKYSSWKRILKSVSFLKHIAHNFKERSDDCNGWHICNRHKTASSLQEAEIFIIQAVQHECFSKEIVCLEKQSDLPMPS